MKGELSGLALGVVVAVVCLFIGLYAISLVNNLKDDSDFYDYSYTIASNTTTQTVQTGTNATHKLTIGAFETIENEATATKSLLFNVTSAAAALDYNISVFIDDVFADTFMITHGTTESNTVSSVSWVASNVNNITYETAAPAGNLTTLKSYATYPSGRTANDWGTISDNMVTNTGTIYDVMILVIIVVALGVAIAVLRGFGGHGGTPTAI
jgi:hypothetical protein